MALFKKICKYISAWLLSVNVVIKYNVWPYRYRYNIGTYIRSYTLFVYHVGVDVLIRASGERWDEVNLQILWMFLGIVFSYSDEKI